jgi:hypothetical protein
MLTRVEEPVGVHHLLGQIQLLVVTPAAVMLVCVGGGCQKGPNARRKKCVVNPQSSRQPSPTLPLSQSSPALKNTHSKRAGPRMQISPWALGPSGWYLSSGTASSLTWWIGWFGGWVLGGGWVGGWNLTACGLKTEVERGKCSRDKYNQPPATDSVPSRRPSSPPGPTAWAAPPSRSGCSPTAG